MKDPLPHSTHRRASTARPAVLAWLRMIRLTGHVGRRWTRILQTHDLNPAQFNVIATIGGAPGLTQRDLSHKLLVTEGNVSQLLRTLERRCLLERRSAGKEKQLYLTATGQTLFGALIPAHEDWLVEQFGALSTDEQTQLADLLRRLERAQRERS